MNNGLAPVIQSSVEKYGTIILQSGFTQHPRSVADYLSTLPLCSTERELILALESFRREPGQEVYPSVRTLAERCQCTERRIQQMTAKLTRLGLIKKIGRYTERSQTTNAYNLDPLYEKVAAWLDPQIAIALEAQEAEQDQSFVPLDILDESALIIAEEFGEPEPAAVRQCASRLRSRWEKVAQAGEWEMFTGLVQQAVEQTEIRKAEPTSSGRTFAHLVAYFFSALDYAISRVPKAGTQPFTQTPAQRRASEPASAAERPRQQTAEDRPGMAELRSRQAERRAAELKGRVKIRASKELQLHIEATALTFHDEQVKSSVQRAANLLADARVSETTFLTLMQTARDITSQRQITKKNGKTFNRMPYFFTILEEEVRKIMTGQVQ
jgi:hypothetical protein